VADKNVRAPAVLLLALCSLLLAGSGFGQNAPEGDLWQEVEQVPHAKALAEAWVKPEVFRTFNLQHSRLRPLLDSAPEEKRQSLASSDALISLPMPDGTTARFRFVESPVMEAELAARFPEIKTYLGRGVDDPTAAVRFDLTPAGFHAQVLSPRGAAYIEPYLRGNTNLHAAYYRADYRPAGTNFQCLVADSDTAIASSAPVANVALSGGTLRTYRLACAATAEYTAYFGGTVPAGLAAIVTAINRVTGVYETEAGIRLVLVAHNDLIIYTNASTEPYSNGSPLALLTQNQTNLDAVIGSTNYDIGHVVNTAGGGLAAVGVAGLGGLKAKGETGIYPPVGDAFYIDYVAHEIGHQFGASHSFNSSSNDCGYGNRTAATAYEPGSGSTITCKPTAPPTSTRRALGKSSPTSPPAPAAPPLRPAPPATARRRLTPGRASPSPCPRPSSSPPAAAIPTATRSPTAGRSATSALRSPCRPRTTAAARSSAPSTPRAARRARSRSCPTSSTAPTRPARCCPPPAAR
jgi:hypothetical protein